MCTSIYLLGIIIVPALRTYVPIAYLETGPINSIGIHPQLSPNLLPMDGPLVAVVGACIHPQQKKKKKSGEQVGYRTREFRVNSKVVAFTLFFK